MFAVFKLQSCYFNSSATSSLPSAYNLTLSLAMPNKLLPGGLICVTTTTTSSTDDWTQSLCTALHLHSFFIFYFEQDLAKLPRAWTCHPPASVAQNAGITAMSPFFSSLINQQYFLVENVWTSHSSHFLLQVPSTGDSHIPNLGLCWSVAWLWAPPPSVSVSYSDNVTTLTEWHLLSTNHDGCTRGCGSSPSTHSLLTVCSQLSE